MVDVLGGLCLDLGAYGFYTLILLAGCGYPADLYEAAEMDGTSKERVFWRITAAYGLTMLVVIVLALIKGVQIFDEVFVLTGGGPGTATVHCPVYLQHRLHQPGSKFWPGLGRVGGPGFALFILTMAHCRHTEERRC